MKYNIIHLNGFMYAVDDKIGYKIAPEEVYYNAFEKTITKASSYGYGKWLIVIATNDRSLNLPLLPTVEEDISFKGFNEVWAKVVEHVDTTLFTRIGMQEFTQSIKKVWEAGYKATKAKQFTEEDLKDAMKVAMKQASSGSSFEDRDFINRHIQFLTPKPIAVELETKVLITDGTYNGRTENEYVPMEFVKTDSTNYVIVKQWYYE